MSKEKGERKEENRRGKGKGRNSLFSKLLVNLRGYRSKEYSLKKSVKEIEGFDNNFK